jgi:hypothetical protein
VRLPQKRRADCDNVVGVEHIDRELDYDHNVTSECDQCAIAQWGPRKGGALDTAQIGTRPPAGTQQLLSIYDAGVAQKIGSVIAKRSGVGPQQAAFTLKAEWLGIEAMDLVAIEDYRILGVSQYMPVRLTSVNETIDHAWQCTGEQFLYGQNHPEVRPISA